MERSTRWETNFSISTKLFADDEVWAIAIIAAVGTKLKENQTEKVKIKCVALYALEVNSVK